MSASMLAPLLSERKVDRVRRDDGILIPRGTSLADAEWLLIDAALQDSGYNRSRAARLLGIGERTLRRKLNKS
ncbi:helix-turn-helix domain-containing protein [Marinobacterium aestuariivivens]|uniref:Helix-turn-helix domain-containing protein n=1 Tax=Marinobacterium aestuariivivens TaxID=1698799 RepID=A0ABW2A4B4_9GAMM